MALTPEQQRRQQAMIDSNRRLNEQQAARKRVDQVGDPAFAEFANNVTPNAFHAGGGLNVGKREEEANRDLALAKGASAADPITQQLKQQGLDAVGRIDPERMQSIADSLQGVRDSATMRTEQGRNLGLLARGQQQGGLDQLGRIASGEDNIAQRQGALQADLAQRRIAGQLAARRGGFSPGAQRDAALAQSQAATDIGAQSALGAATERRAALAQQLAGLQGMRGADITQQGADIQAGLGLGSLAGQQGQLQGLTDAQRGNLFGMFQDRERFGQNQLISLLGGTPAQGPSMGQQIGTIAGGVGGLGLGALLLGLSDEHAKTEVADDGAPLDRFLGALEPKSWRYKPGLADSGAKRHTGVMAQALERSDIGKNFVVEGEDGLKRVDYSPTKLGPVTLAALARLSKRIDNLEG